MKLEDPQNQYVNLDELAPTNQMLIKNLADKYQPKIQSVLKKPAALKTAITVYNKDGKRQKFSIHVSTIYAGKSFAAKGFDYTFSIAAQEAFKSLELEIMKATRTDKGTVRK